MKYTENNWLEVKRIVAEGIEQFEICNQVSLQVSKIFENKQTLVSFVRTASLAELQQYVDLLVKEIRPYGYIKQKEAVDSFMESLHQARSIEGRKRTLLACDDLNRYVMLGKNSFTLVKKPWVANSWVVKHLELSKSSAFNTTITELKMTSITIDIQMDIYEKLLTKYPDNWKKQIDSILKEHVN